jgi:hypothetical protein
VPSAYRNHPFTWTTLAHEAGGHDVVHADLNLTRELAAGVAAHVGGARGAANHGLLWAHWIDRAVADVYGLLNIGPVFAMNLAVFLSTMVSQMSGSSIDVPHLRTSSGPDDRGSLDTHPTDILRVHLAIGATGELCRLQPATRTSYVQALESLATLCAAGATEIALQGRVAVADIGTAELDVRYPIAEMQAAAREAGAYLVTAHLRALGGHSIQDIETWCDADESTARAIRSMLEADTSIAGLGDDAHALAGANLALFETPASYDRVTARVNEALEESFADDPVWGFATHHPAFSVPRRPHTRRRRHPYARITPV